MARLELIVLFEIEIDPDVPVTDLRTMETRIADSLVTRRSPALLAGLFAAIALLLTAIGLAIAYWVVAGIFNAMGNVNTLPAFLAAWSPDLLFGITGCYLFLRSPT